MQVNPGTWYVVTTDSECTVTDANGKTLCTAVAGEQKPFLATTMEVTLSDEGATVTKSTFKRAALALGLFGGGMTSSLPAGYIEAYFLESNGSANINTPYQSGPDTGLYCRSEATYGNRDAVGYATQMSVTRPRFSNANPQAIGASWAGSNVVLLSPLPKSVILDGWLNWKNSKIARAVSELGEQTAGLAGEPTAGRITIFKANSSWYGRIYKAGISEADKVSSMYVPAVDSAGKPCLYDTISKTPLYNTTSTPFVVGLTLAQARKLGNLPYNTTLTISLPVGYDSNEGVVNALAQAEENGCVLTIQTYEVASAATTFALRRVWVRKTQDANGSYVDAENTRWQIEWCVDVIGVDPESLGYERFRSVEVAAEYWGLTPVMEFPEEDLTETE